MFCFPNEDTRPEFDSLSYYMLCVGMHRNFERSSSLEYYHMTCIQGKTKHTSKRVLLYLAYLFNNRCHL